MSAAALLAGTKQLALVAALGQRSDDPRIARLGMASVLLQHQGQVLADEFRTRNLALASGAGEQPIVVSGSSAIVVAFFRDSAMEVI